VTEPTKPGQKCRVIGGRDLANGEGRGPNIGKVVVTDFLHDNLAGKVGEEHEPVWRCLATGSDVLSTYYGAGTAADFLQCWLEVIDDLQDDKSTTTTKDLELTQ
jgi:hypothetical protein